MNKKMIISEEMTIRDALAYINENAKGCVFVVNSDWKMIGILTDGDIRRLLLQDYGLNEVIKKHVNGDYVFARVGETLESVRSKFSHRVNIVPVLDEAGCVADYYELKGDVHIPIAHPQLSGNEFKYLQDAFLSTWISSSGEYISRFENGFAKYCGVKHGIAVSNGTVALHLALLALGIGVGDEVIIPDITFAATINAVLYTGATPVIVDIEEESWCISPDEVKRAITSKTKAIIPVHIYGQPCDMGRIMEIARENHLYVIEDCAEAHGAEFDGKKVGAFGDISCFSFFGNKVITTGEGGMCLTSSAEIEAKIRVLKDHGMSKVRKYYHEVIGYNYRMTNLQAAIGVAQLEQIEEIQSWRYQLEECYYRRLKEIEGVTLQRRDIKGRKKIVWLVTILVAPEKRTHVEAELKKIGVDVREFFIPLSEMDIYREYTFSNCVSSRVSKCGINLPTAYDITEEIIEKIVGAIQMGLAD